MVRNNGHLVISLDFELLWGVFDIVNPKEKSEYFNNTRKVIPKILELFEKHNINATWAIVGMLFHENWQQWEENIPEHSPVYDNANLSAYRFGETIKSRNLEHLVFAPDLVLKIKETAGQEIGTHTYSHYYCLEGGQSKESFRQDLAMASKMAGKFNIKLKSLVFPRNQIDQEYLSICKEAGIKTVRSNPTNWYWNNIASNSLITKVARSGDAYLPFGNKSYSINEIEQKKDFPIEQKASRFLRPVENNFVLRKLKIERIKKEISLAARNNRIYHLWWHPHNFGDRPEESLKDLNEILEHFNVCNKKYKMQSVTMESLSDLKVKK